MFGTGWNFVLGALIIALAAGCGGGSTAALAQPADVDVVAELTQALGQVLAKEPAEYTAEDVLLLGVIHDAVAAYDAYQTQINGNTGTGTGAGTGTGTGTGTGPGTGTETGTDTGTGTDTDTGTGTGTGTGTDNPNDKVDPGSIDPTGTLK
ncbi:hypothetical protein JW859_05460 [bacterium]|nr:hypothetical protein [bacterium]